MLRGGGEIHGSCGELADESVDEGVVMVERALRIMAGNRIASATGQIGRIWQC